MQLVDIREIEDERTTQERTRAAIETKRADKLSSAQHAHARKGQYLDVDGILARSLPLAARSAKDVKTIVSR